MQRAAVDRDETLDAGRVRLPAERRGAPLGDAVLHLARSGVRRIVVCSPTSTSDVAAVELLTSDAALYVDDVVARRSRVAGWQQRAHDTLPDDVAIVACDSMQQVRRGSRRAPIAA